MTLNIDSAGSPDINKLQQRIADLEQQLLQAQRRTEELNTTQQTLRVIIDSLPYAIFWKDRDLIYRGCNQAFANDLGLDSPNSIIGKTDTDLPWQPGEAERFQATDRHVIETDIPDQRIDEEVTLANKEQEWFEAYTIPLHNQQSAVVGVVNTYINITERKRAEATLREAAIQHEIIIAQQAALRELSTPLVPLMQGVVAIPLVGVIDNARAQQIMETLLEGISTLQADFAILDITGVRMIDLEIASALIRTAQAAQMLGAQVILTGMSPEAAQSIVHLDVDLRRLVTYSNLQEGIAYAQECINTMRL